MTSRVPHHLLLHGAAWVLACVGAAACAVDGGKPPAASGERKGSKPLRLSRPAPPSGAAPSHLGVSGKGELVVLVRWLDPPATLVRAGGVNGCGYPRRAPLSVHTLGGVRGAVVFVRGGPSALGPASAPPAAPALAIRDCRVEPPVLVVPSLGSRLTLVNEDERRHDVVLEYVHPKPHRLAQFSLALIGQHVELKLAHPGILRLQSGGDPADAAYLIAGGNAAVSATDRLGKATFAALPAGSYEVVAWHRPLATGPELQVASSATIAADKTTFVTLSFRN